MNLKEKLKEVPRLPGVYQFHNKDGGVIYVGKAKNLKSRIGQYLNGHDKRPQLPYLLAEATDFDYTVVNNELESLFLENTVIKQHLPKYNIMLRDDKNYAFIKIDYSTEIPQIGYARKIESSVKRIAYSVQNKSATRYTLASTRYFGPYSAAYKIRNTLHLMRRIFPYCAAEKVGIRPCFYYYLHRCPGVCIGKISLDEYRGYLHKIEHFLAGDTAKIKKELEAEMKIASGKQEFEKAARLRDQCNALQILEERQTVILPKAVSWDVISMATDAGYACVNLFKVREGKLFDKENFVYEVNNPDLLRRSDLKSEVGAPTESVGADAYGSETLQTFLEQYYLETSSIPKTIYIQNPTEDSELIEHIIHSRFNLKSQILNPKMGKAQELIKLGVTNAEEYLKNWLNDKAGHLDKINKALEGLKEVLHLEKIPERIECYDISNIQGTNAVGSMVVFKNGLPAKSQYRKFKIKTKQTPDDFAMMKEMLARRMSRISNSKFQISNQKSNWPIPDLIVIDGGKGQLSAALEVLQKFQISTPTQGRSSDRSVGDNKFQVIGLAKRIEEIFLPNQSKPIILSHDDPALQLLQRLRDEAHRFGITFHRALRSKQAVKSALDDIPGIGPKTKKLLKQKFGTVSNIRKATTNELKEVVGEKIAQILKDNL